MGWYGNYTDISDAIDSNWLPAFRGEGARYALLDKKIARDTAALLFQEVATGNIYANLMIFRGGMYKPLSWIDRPDFIPAAWKRRLVPFMSDYEREIIREDAANKLEQKQKRQALEDMLVMGAAYKVYGGGTFQFEAVYRYKRKNSHIFEVDGALTRLHNFGRGDYWTLEKIA